MQKFLIPLLLAVILIFLIENSLLAQNQSETYEQLNLFGDVYERVRSEYVDPVTDKELIEHAINGLLSNLDPHSSYLNKEGYKDIQVQTRGEFGGLGIEVTMEDGLVKVVSPIDDTPASRAGIQSGDLIIQIDGEAVRGLTLAEAVDKMRGKVDTQIVITIRRDQEELFDVTIVRDIIKIRSVRHEIEGNIGYIRITTFNEQTQPGLESSIKEIKKELGNELIGYVLDLRNNPGGLLDQAISVADSFLEKGGIVSTRGRHEQDNFETNATPGDLSNGKPIVVLVNSGSASAAEIVAGALQDNRRAVVLGTQTFGKGSVQTIVSIGSHGAMRLTTARYYTPSGRSIQAKGIEPDIIVKAAKIEQLAIKTRRESDLRGALVNNDVRDEDKKQPVANANKKEGESEEDLTNKNLDDEIVDYQLSRALDLLTGIKFFRESTMVASP